MGNFRFKRFEVAHERSSMKVGTDAVLLGAWVNVGVGLDTDVDADVNVANGASPDVFGGRKMDSFSEGTGRKKVYQVLEVGCGCGVISLMLAQRLSDYLGKTACDPEADDPEASDFHITALDIHSESCGECRGNVESSPWAGKVEVWETDFLRYGEDYQCEEGAAPGASVASGPFHLIVSNPPYFLHSLKSPKEVRNSSRHNDSLPFHLMFPKAFSLLRPGGRLAMVLPWNTFEEILPMQCSLCPGLYLSRLTKVFSKPGKACERVLAEWTSGIPTVLEELPVSELYIHQEGGAYSPGYTALVKDFLLWA